MIRRIYVEKKSAVSSAAENLKHELNAQLKEQVSSLRMFIRYDIEGLSDKDFDAAIQTVFSEPPVDDVYKDVLPELSDYTIFAVEYLPGQYDVRADSAAQCVQLMTGAARPEVRCAVVYALTGAKDIQKIKSYLINPVDSRLADIEMPQSLRSVSPAPAKPLYIKGFRDFDTLQIEKFITEFGLAMRLADVLCAQAYFIEEGREPTETEIRVLDCYWSDHCRHTTFLTELTDVIIKSPILEIEKVYGDYKALFNKHYANRSDKYACFMDMATMGARELKSRGLLPEFDESEEINACSIKIKADTSDGEKEYLLMFKNETHNHPTEIEPFGGAATCLGGAIRDPLSGRSYVYHAMRVSGAADITESIDKTLAGRLPQRVISREAARGFSSYGNQIGLATGQVAEVYHPGYAAKRLETGFVVGAVLQENVVREVPEPGDIVVLVGGETGRDGCGGAAGSSKEHNEGSIETSGAEVQKGNPVTERKLQRLFRNPEFSRCIKRCNDFGAGGVCVAIGELADGIKINLDAVPKKYEGLSGTELAISESQERMAIVITPKDFDLVVALCAKENLAATFVAEILQDKRMIMTFNGDTIVDFKRAFLASNGAKQTASVVVEDKIPTLMDKPSDAAKPYLKKREFGAALSAELSRLNVASNKGMGEMFDSTIGSASVFMPYGGKKQLTPAIAMAAKLPTYPHSTDTASVAAWGFDPYLTSESSFIGAQYAVLQSVAKVVATGAPFKGIYLTFQEYFQKLKDCPKRWGQPAAALLGALHAQLKLGMAAIGGKDSMSGTFKDLDVPPTFISFAINAAKASTLITNVLYEGAKVYRIRLPRSKTNVPDYDFFNALMQKMHQSILAKKINYATVVENGGAAAAIAKSCLGNGLGFNFEKPTDDLFYPRFADILVAGDVTDLAEFMPEWVGTAEGTEFVFSKDALTVEKAETDYLKTIATVFPITAQGAKDAPNVDFSGRTFLPYQGEKFAAPNVLIPVFPGTNCEYDTAKQFIDAGAKVELFVFKNRTADEVKQSAQALAKAIANAQIVALAGGFSGGDEPDGSGKFIATVFRNAQIADATAELLEKRQGLMLGICNGFQALIKLGLLPLGKITPMAQDSPTLYFNNINRHVSSLCSVRVASTDSPWLTHAKVGDTMLTAMSHGEGRLIANEKTLQELKAAGRIVTQYVDALGNPALATPHNPNGSMYAIEGLISPCGRILGKMGHVERTGDHLYINVSEKKKLDIFTSGVNFFK